MHRAERRAAMGHEEAHFVDLGRPRPPRGVARYSGPGAHFLYWQFFFVQVA
jgi:hypothetical protein